MSKQALAILAGLIVIFLAWAFGYKVAGQWMDGSVSRSEVASVSVTPDNSEPRSARNAVGDENQGNTDSAQDASEPNSTSQFRYRTYTVDMSGDASRACFTFSEGLDPAASNYMDYVDVNPEVKLSARASASQLCLSGFDYDTDYSVTIKNGLTAKSGLKLNKNATVNLTFGDKPSVVKFAGDGIILPRIGAQGLAVETVNVDVIDVAIYRVNDRIIARRDPSAGEITEAGGYFWEYKNSASNVRETLWEGAFDIDGTKNRTTTTVIDIDELVGELKAGAYVVTVAQQMEGERVRPARAWRWIISTDLAITSYRGTDSLTATVRSIDTARPVKNTRVTLVAQNNDLLGEAVTDNAGRVTFPAALLKGKDATSPKMLMAYGQSGDYAMLDLSRAPLDLSDRNIAGRAVSGPVDIYAYTDRGVYRPGETAHISVMMRDGLAQALEREGKLILLKPNGLIAKELRITDMLAGTFVYDFDIPASAPRGVWTAAIDVDGIGRAGLAEFSVEDFVPQKISVEVDSDTQILTSDAKAVISVQADFLYGAPGKDLEAEADMRIRVEPTPFADFKDYQFGSVTDVFREVSVELGRDLTDATGKAEFEINVSDYDVVSQFPLRAEITAGVQEPGGRYIQNSLRIPLRMSDGYLGIKPGFEDDRVGRRKPAPFQIVAVNSEGKAVPAPDLSWELIRERWDYSWSRQNGRWRYRRDTRDELVQSGVVSLGAGASDLTLPAQNWGTFRLVVTDTKTDMQSSYRYSTGWGNSSETDTPDKISLVAPSAPAKIGRTVKLSVNAPYGGVGELVIAGEDIHEIMQVNLPEGGSEINVPVKESWGAGAYALLTVYTPRSVKDRPIPRRAVGVAYIPVDASDKTLEVAIKAPELTRPRLMQKVELTLTGALESTNYVTLAAIDEGILRITKYDSPSPEDFYFGKKALGLELRDDYARLLNPNLGQASLANSGGDSLGGEGLTSVPVQIVSLFSGPVKTRRGKAVIELDLPEFNGQLRLMAVAWNEKAVGSAQANMTVRDAVPSDLTLPRFMAPGDKAFAMVTLDNVEGKAGAYSSQLSATDVLTFEKSDINFTLETSQRASDTATVIASQTGETNVAFSVKGPGGYNTTARYPFQVRSPYRPVTRTTRKRLESGETISLSPAYLDGLDPPSVDVNISFASGPSFDPAAYAATLSRYPYGCTEQTASSGMPLLYADDIGGIPGVDSQNIRYKMQASVDKLLGRLSDDGAYGLWREGDNNASAWVGAYAAEYIQRAAAKGYDVPDSAMDKTYQGLRKITALDNYPRIGYDYGRGYSDWGTSYRRQRSAEAAAYAHYVLARGGKGDLSQIRYFYDNNTSVMKTSLSYGHIAAALSMMGDNVRASEGFEKAVSTLGYEDEADYYQSALRDTAGLLAIVKEVGNQDNEIKILDAFDADLKDPSDLHTQEKVRVVLAMRALMMDMEAVDIAAKNASVSEAGRSYMLAKGLDAKPEYTNKSEGDVLVTIAISGAPLTAPKPMSKGIILTKTLFDMDGNNVDLSKIARGERLIVKIDFASEMSRERQIVLADLLPAGVEIEAVLTPEDGDMKNGDKGAYAWLGKLSEFDMSEARDDRFVASLKTRGRRDYGAAYIVRAVTAGDFVIPGATIEDMYRPNDQAVTEAGRFVVSLSPDG